MHLYLPARMLFFSNLLGISIILFVGCGSKPERNPLSTETQNITKEEKVEFIVEAVARIDNTGSDRNKYSAPFSRNLAPLRSGGKETYEPWSNPDYDETDDWEGPDLDGWYTFKSYDKNESFKLRFTRRDGRIVKYSAKGKEFVDKVLWGGDEIIREEWLSKYTLPDGKMYDFYIIFDNYYDISLNESPSTEYSIHAIGTVTIPLHEQGFYRISINKDRIRTVRKRPDAKEDEPHVLWEFSGKTTFTTSDNWKGELTYSSSKSFQKGWNINIFGEGDIEDESGIKIATVYYEHYEQDKSGSGYYYIMLDDPTKKRHELDI